jgi:uncharacterized RDD family membrane protein YckC
LRLLGQLLDGVIAALPLMIAFVVAGMSQTVGHVLILAALCVSVAYYFFGDALPGGGSYAKQMLKLEFGERRQRLGDMAAGTIVRVAAPRSVTAGDILGASL